MVTMKKNKNNEWDYFGSCDIFQRKTYCNHCIVIKYEERLKKYYMKIPSHRTKRSKPESNVLDNPKEVLRKNYDEIISISKLICRELTNLGTLESAYLIEKVLFLPDVGESIPRLSIVRNWRVHQAIPNSDKAIQLLTSLHDSLKAENGNELDDFFYYEIEQLCESIGVKLDMSTV